RLYSGRKTLWELTIKLFAKRPLLPGRRFDIHLGKGYYSRLNVSGPLAISENQLFDINGSTRECGMELLTTTEGLYLMKNNESQKLPLSENDLNAEHQLMLTDIDYKSFNLLAMMSKATNKT
ncbi:hypothetical protein BpHYR1_023877, partial [Brachionus plicatilis]